jgi:uncharacterized membrane protein YgcG
MRLFKRRNKTVQTNVPQEVQDYYTAERRERKSVAWLLAIVTFIVTLLIALALFYAGRWVYRKVSDRNKTTTETSQTKDETTDQSSSGGSSESGSSNPANGSEGTTAPGTSQSGQGSASSGGSSSDQQTSSTSTSTPSPAVGGSSTEIPRTGPDLDL